MPGVNHRIVTKEQTSFTELQDNREGIILDLENLHYFTLNGSAIIIWKLLRSGACDTADLLTARLVDSFGLDPEQAIGEINSFLDELKNQGLISFVEFRDHADSAKIAPPHEISLPAYVPPTLRVSESLSQVTLSGSSTVATAAIATGGNG